MPFISANLRQNSFGVGPLTGIRPKSASSEWKFQFPRRESVLAHNFRVARHPTGTGADDAPIAVTPRSGFLDNGQHLIGELPAGMPTRRGDVYPPVLKITWYGLTGCETLYSGLILQPFYQKWVLMRSDRP